MDQITRLYVRLTEAAANASTKLKGNEGQTMTEYALILSAVGVVVYGGYKTMGTVIKSLLVTVDGQL